MKISIPTIAILVALLISVAFSQNQNMPAPKKQTSPSQTTPAPDDNSKRVAKKPAEGNNKTNPSTSRISGKSSMIQGKVMYLTDFIAGNKNPNNNSGQNHNSGQPLVLVIGEGNSAKAFFVYHTDGSFAGSTLTSYIGKNLVSITGKTKTVKGVNVIFADKIEAGS